VVIDGRLDGIHQYMRFRACRRSCGDGMTRSLVAGKGHIPRDDDWSFVLLTIHQIANCASAERSSSASPHEQQPNRARTRPSAQQRASKEIPEAWNLCKCSKGAAPPLEPLHFGVPATTLLPWKRLQLLISRKHEGSPPVSVRTNQWTGHAHLNSNRRRHMYAVSCTLYYALHCALQLILLIHVRMYASAAPSQLDTLVMTPSLHPTYLDGMTRRRQRHDARRRPPKAQFPAGSYMPRPHHPPRTQSRGRYVSLGPQSRPMEWGSLSEIFFIWHWKCVCGWFLS